MNDKPNLETNIGSVNQFVKTVSSAKLRVLIIGAKGYVGSKLARSMVQQGYQVTLYDLPENDILNVHSLDNFVKGHDTVYHLAALAEIKYTDDHPEETYDVNLTGLRNVIASCIKHDVLLNFISTCCIYGNPLELPSREDSNINPSDTYAMSKAAGEYVVKMFALASKLRFNILRLGTVYGHSTEPDLRQDMCTQIFLSKAMKGQPLPINGSGRQVRNYIHIDDLVGGLIAVTEKQVEGETINLAGSEQISVLEIAEECLFLSGQPSNNIEYWPERKDDFAYQLVSIEKAFKLLDWKPTKIFKLALKEHYDWLKER